VARDTFGFVLLDARDAGWATTLRDVDGATELECAIAARGLACPGVAAMHASWPIPES